MSAAEVLALPTPAAPAGYCQCGCGERTPVAARTNRSWGAVKGEPLRFLHGHAQRLRRRDEYQLVDHGYDTTCWEWLGCTNSKGYPVKSVDGRRELAHRVYYEHFVAPIPGGLQLDHLCRYRRCVRPDHLEPVTQIVNMQRARAAAAASRRSQGLPPVVTDETTIRRAAELLLS